MSVRSRTAIRTGALVAVVAIALATAPHRSVVEAAQASLLVQVRTALAHGDVQQARRLATGGAGAEGGVAQALVEMFVGQDAAARERLVPLADANPMGEAALELGLLDLRRGRRDEANARLQPLASARNFNGPDDFFRLARAAQGVREFLLANDAYVRTMDVPRADIQAAWGDMVRIRYRFGDAVTSFRDALEADPEWVPAIVGIAKATLPESAEAAGAALAEARAIAPDHPDVRLFSAELAIQQKEYEAAAGELDALAAVRPGTVEEAAWRAALAYHSGGEAAAMAAMPAVAERDPRSALGYRYAAEQAAHDFKVETAMRIARAGAELDPDDPYIHLDLGMYLLRHGDEDEARVVLERSWALDESAPITKNSLDLLDTVDTFTVVETDRMIFKFDRGEAAALEPYAVPLAETAYDTFAERYGFTPEGPILIEVFSRRNDFAVRTVGLTGLDGALGACFGRVVTMNSPSARDPGVFSWHATLWHEMAHVFSLQLSGYEVPRWLTEGISTFEEHRRVPAWGRELTLQFAQQLSAGRTFGVKALPDAFKRPESLALAYFEASLLVEHLVEENGDAGLRTLLLAYADGATDADAFSRAFGQSVDDVEASFARFVNERYGDLAAAMGEPPSQAAADDIAALAARAAAAPGNYESQYSYGRALFSEARFDEATPVLERAAALAPQATGDGSPNALLARIAEQQGDVPAARRHLRSLLDSNHENVGAARTLALLSAEGAAEDLDYGLRLWADLDPFDNDVHARLGKRLLEQDRFGEALVEFEVALALGPPNLAEAHTDIAESLLRLGRNDEARASALEALKEAPTFARAQDLLLEAIGRRP